MKKAIVLGALALLLTACSGGSKGQFMDNCQNSLSGQLGGDGDAKVACTCMFERLSDELSADQMAMAAEVVGLENNGAISEYAAKHKGADMVSERVQGAAKSCVG